MKIKLFDKKLGHHEEKEEMAESFFFALARKNKPE